MNEEQFISEIAWFCEYYSGYVMNSRMIKVWFALATRYTQGQLRQAMMDHIKNDENPNFPAFGKIYKQLIKIKRVEQ